MLAVYSPLAYVTAEATQFREKPDGCALKPLRRTFSLKRQEALRQEIERKRTISRCDALWEGSDCEFVTEVKDKTIALRHRTIALLAKVEQVERPAAIPLEEPNPPKELPAIIHDLGPQVPSTPKKLRDILDEGAQPAVKQDNTESQSPRASPKSTKKNHQGVRSTSKTKALGRLPSSNEPARYSWTSFNADGDVTNSLPPGAVHGSKETALNSKEGNSQPQLNHTRTGPLSTPDSRSPRKRRSENVRVSKAPAEWGVLPSLKAAQNAQLATAIETAPKPVFEEVRNIKGLQESMQGTIRIYNDEANHAVHLEVWGATLAGKAHRQLSTPECEMLWHDADMQGKPLETRYKFLSSLVNLHRPEDDGGALSVVLRGYDQVIEQPSISMEESFKQDMKRIFSDHQTRALRELKSDFAAAPAGCNSERDVEVKQISLTFGVREHIVTMLRDWYDRVDTSGDGVIDEFEFGTFMHKVYQACDRATVNDAIIRRAWKEVLALSMTDNTVTFLPLIEWLLHNFPQIRSMKAGEVRRFIRKADR